jgi:hypothetical protein
MPSWRNRKSRVNLSQRCIRITDARSSAKFYNQVTKLRYRVIHSIRNEGSKQRSILLYARIKCWHRRAYPKFLGRDDKEIYTYFVTGRCAPYKILSFHFSITVQHFWNWIFVMRVGRSVNAPEFERHLKKTSSKLRFHFRTKEEIICGKIRRVRMMVDHWHIIESKIADLTK